MLLKFELALRQLRSSALAACGCGLLFLSTGCGMGANTQRADQAKQDFHKYSEHQEENIEHLQDDARRWAADPAKRAGKTKESFHRYSEHQEENIDLLTDDARRWAADPAKRAGKTKENFHRYSEHQEENIEQLEEDSARRAIGPKGELKPLDK